MAPNRSKGRPGIKTESAELRVCRKQDLHPSRSGSLCRGAGIASALGEHFVGIRTVQEKPASVK